MLAGAEPLSVDGGPTGLLLLHGFGGTPGLFTSVADAARAAGITFRAPLLPGHGTTVDDLAGRTFGDWVEAVATQVVLLGERCDRVVLGGFSAGGAVAAAVAAAVPVDGLVLINPLLKVDPETEEIVAEAIEAGWDALPEPELDLGDPSGAAGYVCYDAIPTATLRSLHQHLPSVLAGLAAIRVPVLLVVSGHDAVLAPGWDEVVAARLASPPEVLRLARSRHLAPLDAERDQMAAAVVRFVAG